jgi:hypothetical protein
MIVLSSTKLNSEAGKVGWSMILVKNGVPNEISSVMIGSGFLSGIVVEMWFI